MLPGSGLEFSGGKLSLLRDLAKGAGKAADIATPLAQAPFGVEGADINPRLSTQRSAARALEREPKKKCWLLPRRGLEPPIS